MFEGRLQAEQRAGSAWKLVYRFLDKRIKCCESLLRLIFSTDSHKHLLDKRIASEADGEAELFLY